MIRLWKKLRDLRLETQSDASAEMVEPFILVTEIGVGNMRPMHRGADPLCNAIAKIACQPEMRPAAEEKGVRNAASIGDRIEISFRHYGWRRRDCR